jgi:uncharacterized protein involved in exopolysaccharide biosynthesis
LEKQEYINRDVIDLRELLQIIKKSKKLIYIITGLITGVAILYAFVLAKPLYEVKAMIEIGKINDNPLDKVEDVKQKLEYIYGVNTKKKRDFPRIKVIRIPKKSNSFIYIYVESGDNQSAIQYINKITHNLEHDYAEKINAHINTQKELLKLNQHDITVTQKNLSDAETLLKNYAQKILDITQKDAALAGLYSMQISDIQSRIQDLQSHISTLKQQEYKLKLSLSPLKIKNTEIVGEVEISETPVKPKKALIVIVAFITGLMFSIFLVFFLSFIQGIKEEA